MIGDVLAIDSTFAELFDKLLNGVMIEGRRSSLAVAGQFPVSLAVGPIGEDSKASTANREREHVRRSNLGSWTG